MERTRILLAVMLICSMTVTSHGSTSTVHRPFSALKNNLVVEATAKKGALMAGEDKFDLRWGPNKNTSAKETSTYKTIKVKLCYTEISQKDRPWRNTNHDNIGKDKTCQFVMFTEKYEHKMSDIKTYNITKEIPGAIYFIRVYAFGDDDKEVAYGQTPAGVVFDIVGITGRGTSIDIAAAVFSAFSVVSLGYFFYMEKRKAKMTTVANGST